MARRQKISQMTPKGANLQATDLLEISELSGTGYITKSITGQEIINAGGGGGSQDLQQVTNIGATSTNTIVVLDNPSSTNYLSIIDPYVVEVVNNITNEQSGLFSDKIQIIKSELSISRGGIFKISNVTSPNNVTLEFPNKTTGSYTIATTADIPSVSGFVPYTGATADVNLGTFHLDAAKGTFTHNGSTDTLTANHTSGSGIGLLITKGGANEGLKVNKTSGSGNAATIIGTLEATTLVKTGGTSSQYLMADGSTNTLNQAAILSLLGWFKTLVTANTTITGTTGETIISSTQVPTLSNGTIFKINTLRITKGILAGSTIRAYLSPNSANLSGALQILSTGSVIVAGTRLATISRVFEIEGGNIKGLNASTGVLNDNGTSTVAGLDAALPSGTLYLIVTVTNSLTTESTTQELLDISNF
jgi:hypothetical protein